MKIIDRYIARAILSTTLVVAVALLGITFFLSLLEELESVGRGTYSVRDALQYVLLMMPKTMYQMFPLIVMLGTILGLGTLAGTGELVVIRAAGVSIWRIGGSALKAGLLLAALCFVTGDWIAPKAEEVATQLRTEAKYGVKAGRSNRGLWLRAGPDYVRIGRLDSHREVRRLEVYRLDESLALTQTIEARNAVYEPDGWQLSDVLVRNFTDAGIVDTRSETLTWAGELDPGVLKLVVLRRANLSTAGLYRYVNYLRANGLDDASQQLQLWRKIIMPFTVLVMMLVAVPFVMGQLRDAGAGQRLFIGVMVGVGFYLLNEVTANSGVVFGLNPVLTAAGPTLLVGAIAAWRLVRLR